MAPACVATIFDGANGGASSTGVTATEVRIAVPALPSSWRPALDAVFEYLNSRFELYGRRLVPVITNGNAWDAVTARATGADIAAQDVFAALPGWLEDNGGAQVALMQQLARSGVITVARNIATWLTDENLFDPWHPYIWSVYPSAEDQQRNIADFACTALAGRTARHAGDPALRNTPRRFAILALGRFMPPPSKVLERALTECTGERPLTSLRTWNYNEARTWFQQLKDSGATTVVCVCEDRWPHDMLVSQADGVGFHPEWIVSPTINTMQELYPHIYRSSYGERGPIQIAATGAILPNQARPWFQAVLSTRPELLATLNDFYNADAVGEYIYPSLMVLASGIQSAGPVLTPETFAAGLMTAQFPNPNAGAAPYWQPSIGFGAGDHSFYDDYLVAWWSDTAPYQTPLEGEYAPEKGSWCYLDQGARFREGTYPANADTLLHDSNASCR